ncbi:hypothetical protein Lfu02_01680 [Longispora fulva]|uniref:Uncharacterized protein n=1 Tax=Longispora fulva TaxID=619741 RepID=A0A8J7KFB1_9ACTN|nr:hypothetical protein [Longispora fulva]MBG6135960.1 hypothetical protein [Longispora fulva]GIG55796.1 hypothetical protein Lfu02_01680 [Longispora fulva]
MSINRGIRLSVAVAVLGVAASVTFAAPAQAAVNPAACKYSYDRYREHVSATCYDDNLSRWQLRAHCWTVYDDNIYINGTFAYGPGTGTSMVTCTVGELVDYTIVVVNL